MKRILSNLQKKSSYYNEILKLTTGLIYDIQNGGNENEFSALVSKRVQMMNFVTALDTEREKIIRSFPQDKQTHIKNLLLCRDKPVDPTEKAIYDISSQNRMLIRKISTYNKNLNTQVSIFMKRTAKEQ